MNKLVTMVAAAGLAIAAAPAAYAITLIDDFTSVQVVSDLPSGGDRESELADASVLGGFRHLSAFTNPQIAPLDNNATRLVSGDTTNGTVPPNSELTFSNGAGQTGIGWIVYDGAGGYDGSNSFASINTTGLGTVDFTNGGSTNGFFFEVTDFDAVNVLNIEVRVFSAGGGESIFTETLSPGFNPVLRFSQFAGNANFEAAGALAFRISTADNTSFDGAIGSISVVPLPASALLLLGGLAGFGGISASKRRRKS